MTDASSRQARGPLAGRTVAVTRSDDQAAAVKRALERLDAEVMLVPSIRQVSMPHDAPDARLLLEPSRFTHVVFTSQATVRFFFEFLDSQPETVEGWKRCRVAAVGSRTGTALREGGLPPDLVASEARGKALAHEPLKDEGLGPQHRVLLPQSSVARPELQDLLAAAGVPVETAVIYETITEDVEKARPFLEAVEDDDLPDAITFFSPSAVRGFLEMTGEPGRAALLREELRIISIGPTTSEAIRSAGFEVTAEAGSPSSKAVAKTVVESIRGIER